MRRFEFELSQNHDIIANNITLESCGTHHATAAFFILGDFMARTATSTKAETQETLIENTDDNYPLLVTIAATNNPDQLPGGAMTQGQARAHVRDLQRQGFKILSSQALESGDVNGIFTVKLYYCLVKQ